MIATHFHWRDKPCNSVKLIKVNHDQCVNLLCLIYISKNYNPVFDGKLERKRYKVSLRVHADVVPTMLASAFKCNLNLEIVRLEILGVIAKVDEPTEWVNQIVVMKRCFAAIKIA